MKNPTSRKRLRYVGAVVAGLVTTISLAPWAALPAVVVGPALIFRFLFRDSRFVMGFLFGLGLLGPQMFWLWNIFPLAPFLVVPISACAYGLAFQGAGESPLRFAASFTAAEVVRSVGTFAFPWGLLGTAAGGTLFQPAVAVGGVFALTFLFAGLGAAIIARRQFLYFLGPLVLLVPLGASTGWNSGEPAKPISIGVVQANFADDADYAFRPRECLDHLIRETRGLVARGAKIVVWTETVVLEYLNRESGVRREIEGLAAETGITIVCGAPAILPGDEKRNSGFVISPRGIARYDKYHLVPFGEYIPGLGPDRDHRWISEGRGDFMPAVLPFSQGGLGILICYEGAFPALARTLVRQGAGLLINISNDAWEKSSAEAEQHCALASLRAVETGRPLVRAANVGRSAIIDGRGEVLDEIEPGRSGALLAQISPGNGWTPALAFGDWAGWICLIGLPFYLTARAADGEDGPS